MEARIVEMAVERENPQQTVCPHQSERGTIRKAHLLVCVLSEEIQRFEFDLLSGTKDLQMGRRVEGPYHLCRELIPDSSSDQVRCFVEHKVAGKTARLALEKLTPGLGRYRRVLVTSNMARDEGASINKDQSSSP
jgi:hypothetical protein